MRQQRRKTRVRTGCTTCKHRKIKCDEAKPVCRRCDNGNWKCKYLIPKTWIVELPATRDLSQKNIAAPDPDEHKSEKDLSKPVLNILDGEPVPNFRPADENKPSTTQPLDESFIQQNLFSLLSLPAERHTAFGVDVFVNAYAPSQQHLVTLRDGTNGLLTRLLPWALQDNLILDALMAESLAFYADGDVQSELGRSALSHRQSSIAEIMQRLSNTKCDHSVIQAVIILIFVDMRLGYLDHVQAHLQGLRAMVPVCGGLNHLGCDGMQKDIIVMFNDVYNFLDDSAFGTDSQSQIADVPISLKYCSMVPDVGAKKSSGDIEVSTKISEKMLFPFLSQPPTQTETCI